MFFRSCYNPYFAFKSHKVLILMPLSLRAICVVSILSVFHLLVSLRALKFPYRFTPSLRKVTQESLTILFFPRYTTTNSKRLFLPQSSSLNRFGKEQFQNFLILFLCFSSTCLLVCLQTSAGRNMRGSELVPGSSHCSIYVPLVYQSKEKFLNLSELKCSYQKFSEPFTESCNKTRYFHPCV